MKTKILFIERKPEPGKSIEIVFRQLAKSLSSEKFETSFQQLHFLNNTFGTIKNLIFFRKKKADIYHVTGHVHYIALILPSNKTVLTIHDLGILSIRKGLRRFVLKKLLFDLPVKKLKYITTISEATKAELIFYTKCRSEKIRVIENPLQENLLQSRAKTFNAVKPTILQVGTRENKNLPNLIKALENISCRLKIIGELSDSIKEILEICKIDFENKVNLDNFQMKEEYGKADIVAFCSTFEGFGLPIIEAQAMQVPVITSDLSPMKEVAGNGAVLVNPLDYMSIRKGIEQVIGNPELREDLIEKGSANIKRFEPGHIARLYENFYDEIIKNENL